MEAAKAAVSKFTGNKGHHTSVEESVAPAITHEAIHPHRHEEATQAVDREVHQHHYHTTVQPLSHKETLPEKHTHNLLPTEHREFHHGDAAATKEKVATELGRFKDHSTTHETHHTHAAAPAVAGEHVHHHVHETVVPVVHKETIQPEVVHTTVPIHETHHAAAQHHGLSALPMKTLDEFKKVGGALTGGERPAHEEYDGAPRAYNDKFSTTFEKLEEKFHHGGNHNTTSPENTTGHHGGHHNTTSLENTTGTGPVRSHGHTGSGIGSVEGREHLNGNNGIGGREHLNGNSTNVGKPTATDRLNPRVDADGDGKRGVLD